MEEIIDKLKDLNNKTEGLYAIRITAQGIILLTNYKNVVFIADTVQDLREEMYRIILKQNS